MRGFPGDLELKVISNKKSNDWDEYLLEIFPSVAACSQLERRSSDGEDAFAGLVEPTLCCKKAQDVSEFILVDVELFL